MAILNRQPDTSARASRRASDRHRLSLGLSGESGDGDWLDILVDDLSAGGFSVQLRRRLNVGDLITVNLPDATQVNARIVWQKGNRSGCKFERNLSRAELAVARLKAEPRVDGGKAGYHLDDEDQQRYPRRIRAFIWIAGATIPWVVAYLLFANRP